MVCIFGTIINLFVTVIFMNRYETKIVKYVWVLSFLPTLRTGQGQYVHAQANEQIIRA